jgi:hypothetical protein
MGLPLSVHCSGGLMDRNKLHSYAKPAETGFWLFKEQVPFKFRNEISAVQ